MGHCQAPARCCEPSNEMKLQAGVSTEYVRLPYASCRAAASVTDSLKEMTAADSEPYPSARSVESLDYCPSSFDVVPTTDEKRSPERYEEVVLHFSGGRIQRQSKLWETCLRDGQPSRAVVLLLTPPAGEVGAVERIPAMYYISSDLQKLALHPQAADVPALSISVDSIDAICSASSVRYSPDWSSVPLSECEMNRAVLIRYASDDSGFARVRFLMKNRFTAECFVLALISLWVEKPWDAGIDL
eukprot:NODE_15884_length_1024_cov_3.753623.p1 GENE.NODE_15884_length_1024_cov_3.753623~~NODE_15884_length_1024_cov_3.753623.p1  ORF type:complete len:244 (-),score=50.50 NODE_15884_length_1024_cov_3.753623:84-815(-)